MAKTLRVRTRTGWVTKAVEDILANRLTAQEIDDNFLALEDEKAPTALAVADTSNGLMSGADKGLLWTPHSFKNKIVNGDFEIWQRSIAASTGSGYQNADRFGVYGVSSIPILRRISLAPGGIPGCESRYCLRINTTAQTADTDYQYVGHRIEGVRTFEGHTATLSFWTYCTTNLNMSVGFQQNFGSGGTPSSIVPLNGTPIKMAVGPAWTRQTVIVDISSIDGKTLGTNPDDYLFVMFWLSAGANYNATTDSLGHQTGQFYIADIQMEQGASASPFAKRPPSVEALLCYRYFFKLTKDNYIGNNFNSYAAGAIGIWDIFPPVPMRASPTLTSSFSNVTFSKCQNMFFVTGGGSRSLVYCSGTEATTNAFWRLGTDDHMSMSAEL